VAVSIPAPGLPNNPVSAATARVNAPVAACNRRQLLPSRPTLVVVFECSTLCVIASAFLKWSGQGRCHIDALVKVCLALILVGPFCAALFRSQIGTDGAWLLTGEGCPRVHLTRPGRKWNIEVIYLAKKVSI
jgi:hypothetical protein